MPDSRYRVQYGDKERFAEWSEWFETGTPLPTSNILSIQTEQVMTVEQWNQYAKQFNETT